VVWTGIEPYDMLVALMNNLHSDLASVGFEPDRQNQVPHLTLGRIKSLSDRVSFQRTVDRFRTIRSETETIDTIILYESILRREGSEYREVETFGLA
jgi:2'-5' RNA ligase